MNLQLFRECLPGVLTLKRHVNTQTQRTLGIIGAGKVGTALARLATAAGWNVALSGSPRQPMQGLIVETLVPGARLLPEAEVVAGADLVIVAIPFGKADSVDWSALGGKVVVDATNYWYPVDGHVADADAFEGSTAEFTLARNPAMRLVKSLNHLGYHDMETDARPAGDPLRRSLVAASDDEEARRLVAGFIDDIGFDPVLTGLADGVLLEPEGPVFGIELSAEAMIAALDGAAGRGTAAGADEADRRRVA